MTGLSPGSTYYFEAYAANSAGTSYGSALSFTAAAAAPTVTSSAATNVTAIAATLNGSIATNGGEAVTDYGFYWGTSGVNSSLISWTNYDIWVELF